LAFAALFLAISSSRARADFLVSWTNGNVVHFDVGGTYRGLFASGLNGAWRLRTRPLLPPRALCLSHPRFFWHYSAVALFVSPPHRQPQRLEKRVAKYAPLRRAFSIIRV
jgi:hypothetical protein